MSNEKAPTTTSHEPVKKSTQTSEVGYAKPPRHTQFKKNQSGNPKGRPKGSKNMRKMLYEYGDQLVETKINGKKAKVSMKEAAIMRIWQNALNGDDKALRRILENDEYYHQRRKENAITYEEWSTEQSRMMAAAVMMLGTEEFNRTFTDEYRQKIWDIVLSEPGLDREVVSDEEKYGKAGIDY